MTGDIFDFGFTAVDEGELAAVQDAATAKSSLEHTQEKLDKLYRSIQPLLKNLKKDPEKDYIYWPKRQDKISEFEKRISEIYNS